MSLNVFNAVCTLTVTIWMGIVLHARWTFVAFAMLALCGCSATVTHEMASDAGKGIRYYEQSPYLLIYSNSKGGLRWQVLYLPDQTKKMMATPKVFFGRSEMTLFFQNGVLASSTEFEDTTQVPKAIIAALQSAVPLLAMGALSAEKNIVPAPYIYKIVAKDGKLGFIGAQGDSGIVVPFQPGK